MSERGVSRHLARPVDEGQAVLCGEFNRNKASFKQDLCRGSPFAVDQHMPLSNEGQGKMGEGSEITACTKAPDTRDSRVNAVVEVQHQLVNAIWMNSRMALAE